MDANDDSGQELVWAGDGPLDMSGLAAELVAGARDRGIDLTGEGRLLTALTRQVLQSALEAEVVAHLGYDKHYPAGRNLGNSRNGSPPKTEFKIGRCDTRGTPRRRSAG